MFANEGYVAMNIGLHQTNLGVWSSDLAEGAKAALDALCTQTYADCGAVVITGESYSGTQIHPVVRYLRAGGVFDGSGGANAGRMVVGILGQDSGYTQYWAAPIDADATAYSIAMIENLGDSTFPVDSCADGNCGARNRADYHKTAAGSQYVLSYCPAGGTHGSRGYANWDAWVLSAVKTMLHNQRGVPKFTGYVEPSLAVSNACVTTLTPSQADCFFNWAEKAAPQLFAPAGATSNTWPPFYYRYYSLTNAYLVIYSVNNHVYYLGPVTKNAVFDVGALSTWLATAGCQ